MEAKKESVYLGIELNEKYAMISYYQQNMKEPETVSTIAGGENCQIPLLLAKRKNMGQWFYGEDARKMAKTSEVICVDSLLKRAVNGESIRIEESMYEAWELLALYLRKLLDLPLKLGIVPGIDKVVLTVERLTQKNMEIFWKIAQKLGFLREQFMVLDHKESFYYFTLSQPAELWMHAVYLFEYQGSYVHYYALHRDIKTKPQVISVKESIRYPMEENDKDAAFLMIQQKAFENQLVSTVFLVGDRFAKEWMHQSLSSLCRNRRVFIGNNLYSKGACYAAVVRENEKNWNFIYMGENEMKFNLSIKVKNRGSLAFYTLISAGDNWFETQNQCDVILSGGGEIAFWKQLPYSREASIETLELTDLPERPKRTTRLRITAVPLSNEKIEVQIQDLGFGEIYRGTEKVWKYTMTM